jgi:hypothetical protein
MMPKKPALHLMRGGYRFPENIMLQQVASMERFIPEKNARGCVRVASAERI